MTRDYSYCVGDKCIHRRGCKRYLNNYILEFIPTRWIKESECINSEPLPYAMLDRFRNSDGSKLESI